MRKLRPWLCVLVGSLICWTLIWDLHGGAAPPPPPEEQNNFSMYDTLRRHFGPTGRLGLVFGNVSNSCAELECEGSSYLCWFMNNVFVTFAQTWCAYAAASNITALDLVCFCWFFPPILRVSKKRIVETQP